MPTKVAGAAVDTSRESEPPELLVFYEFSRSTQVRLHAKISIWVSQQSDASGCFQGKE